MSSNFINPAKVTRKIDEFISTFITNDCYHNKKRLGVIHNGGCNLTFYFLAL